MRADNPAALRFILEDDIYLLQRDKIVTKHTAPQPVAEPVLAPVSAVAEVIAEPVEATTAIKFNYLGKNKKQFLILTYYTGHDFIADDHLTALQNILKRKEYDIDDVAILNTAKNTIAGLDDLVAYFTPKKLLILGESALPAKLTSLTLNQPENLQSGATLYSFSFDEMMSSTDNKKAFWDQMKNL